MIGILQSILHIAGLALFWFSCFAFMAAILYLLSILVDMFKQGVPRHAKRFGIALLYLAVIGIAIWAGAFLIAVSGQPLRGSPDGIEIPPPI